MQLFVSLAAHYLEFNYLEPEIIIVRITLFVNSLIPEFSNGNDNLIAKVKRMEPHAFRLN